MTTRITTPPKESLPFDFQSSELSEYIKSMKILVKQRIIESPINEPHDYIFPTFFINKKFTNIQSVSLVSLRVVVHSIV